MLRPTGPDPDESNPETRVTLLSRIRDHGDDASWTRFFETYWRLIYRCARRLGLGDAEAQDVVQDVVLEVSRKIGRFRYDPEKGSFKGWLLRLTQWRAQDRLRRRRPVPAADLGEFDEDSAERILEIPVSSELEAVWEEEWKQNLLSVAWQRLRAEANPRHYQAFELYIHREWPAQKVSEFTGVPVEQVYLIGTRLKAQFSAILEELGREEA